MNGLTFELAAPAPQADPNRVDIACFVGFVGRRPTPLPAAVRAALAQARWTRGPWARPADEIEALLQLPVTVDSWSAFDALFAWDERPVAAGATRRCATLLGAAVRRFFAEGGQRAVIVRAGDPWPWLEGSGGRGAGRAARLAAVLAPAASATDPASWRGLGQLHGLPEVALVCLPDLPDICAADPARVDVALEPPAAPEVFVACSDGAVAPVEDDLGLRDLAPPRCDAAGFRAWHDALGAARAQLARHHRDKLLLAALPLPAPELHHAGVGGRRWAQADLLGYLEQAGLLDAPGSAASEAANGATIASAFVQLAWPWLKTRHSADLAGAVEPPDGLLAGLLARNALARGTFRSVAGTPLAAVFGTEPVLAWSSLGPSPADRLARRVCVVAPEPGGWALHSDVSASADEAWRAGGVTRLFGAVLRAAREVGTGALFEASGPALWHRIERSLEAMLTAFWREGGLGGASPEEAFSVRCGPATMSLNDLDHGRLRAEVTLLPAAAVERITVVLDLRDGSAAAPLREVA